MAVQQLAWAGLLAVVARASFLEVIRAPLASDRARLATFHRSTGRLADLDFAEALLHQVSAR